MSKSPSFRPRIARPYVPGLLGLLTMLALAVFFAGCSTAPVPPRVNPTAYTQERVQAADHWRNMAEDTAKSVVHALEERRDLIARPLYIQPPNGRPFSIAFYDLVKSELVSRAVQISQTLEPDTLRLEYHVQTVVHDASRSGTWGIGQHEIVVNVRMAVNNRYVMHKSFIHYINEADWPLYLSPESQDPAAGSSRNLRIIKR